MTESCTMLVTSAIDGDEEAWNELFAKFNPLLRAISRTFRLNDEQRADAAQNTWMLLVVNIRTVRDPEKVGAWLSVTMRRQCIRIASARRREELRGEWHADELSTTEGPEDHILRAEKHAELWEAIDRLPARQRQLLQVLSMTPKPSYQTVSAMLEMPLGSIGPTRERALRRLARLLTEPNVIDVSDAAEQVAHA
jgi:RNA polymerase sigma factor (sigma-70 family)